MKHQCPMCRKPTDSATDADFPFCSERCRLQDLGNWASERYVVSEPFFDEEENESGQPASRPPGSRGSNDADPHEPEH